MFKPRSLGSKTHAAAGTLVVGALLAGCGGGGDQQGGAAPASGTFVGETKTENGEPFVAVVAAPAKAGQQQRDVKVYVCDGDGINEWLPGKVTGENFKLTSDDGDAEVTGKLASDSVTGTVELPDGKVLNYETKPATGPGGLYTITAASDGAVRGTSSTGGRFQGRVVRQPRGYRLTGTVTTPDGKRSSLQIDRVPFRPTGAYRWIVASDGELLGGKRSKGREGGGGDFVNQIIG